MSNVTERFIKGSDNVITLTLTENDAAIVVTWLQVDIYIGDGVVISRTTESGGVGFANGILTITPSGLTEDLSGLLVGKLYRVYIKVSDANSTDGSYFGADDSANKLFFEISDPPG